MKKKKKTCQIGGSSHKDGCDKRNQMGGDRELNDEDKKRHDGSGKKRFIYCTEKMKTNKFPCPLNNKNGAEGNESNGDRESVVGKKRSKAWSQDPRCHSPDYHEKKRNFCFSECVCKVEKRRGKRSKKGRKTKEIKKRKSGEPFAVFRNEVDDVFHGESHSEHERCKKRCLEKKNPFDKSGYSFLIMLKSRYDGEKHFSDIIHDNTDRSLCPLFCPPNIPYTGKSDYFSQEKGNKIIFEKCEK